MSSIRFRNATVVTQNDEREVLHGDVYVEDHRIVAVGDASAKVEADHEIDAAGQVLIPGLINLHTHLAMGLFRGYGDDMHLEEWLQERIWPAEDNFTDETMRAGVDLGLLEMIENGTTSYLDMYMEQDTVAAAAARSAGVRGWLGIGMVDVGQTEEGEPNAKIGRIEDFVKATRHDPLVRGCPAPHGTYTCHPETYAESARIAQAYEVPMHTHCSETRKEVYDVQQDHGDRPVAKLAQYGALGEHSVLAHCGWITKQEASDIAQAGAGVAHCPVSNMKLATGGVCPVPELQEAGAKVGLGTDGAASNNSTDLFETMKFAALVQKQHRWDATALPAQRALDMATRAAAEALNRPDLGWIVPGATADLALVDFRRPQLTPHHDVVSHLVYATSGRDVSATVVHGRPLMLDGQVQTMQADAVLERARDAARALVAS